MKKTQRNKTKNKKTRKRKNKTEIKLIKIGKRPETTYCLGCKGYMQNFRPQEVKMANKVLREKFHCVVYQ